MRFFDEMRDPALKCQRVGHKERNEYRSGYTWPKHSWHVADSVEQSRCVCGRCGLVLIDWQDTSRSGLSGLTLNTDRMRDLDKNGAVWL